MAAAIAITGLVKEFPGPGGRRVRAVDGLSLEVEAGEILGFLGPNGAGKTTTIKMILGLVRPDAGRIQVLGLDPGRQRAQVLRRVGAVLEGNRNVYWDLTVYENLRYFGGLKQVPPSLLAGRIAMLLHLLDLEEKRHTVVKHLSRGMQQKLAIACALVHAPPVLLLDEPTLGLDVAAARLVKERVRDLARRGCTVVLTTHQLDVVQELCHRVAIVRRGRLVALDRTEALLGRFARHEYELRLSAAVPEGVLAPWGFLAQVQVDGAVACRLLLPDGDALLPVLDAVRRAGARVLAVQRREPDLEDVFLYLTGEVAAGA